MAGWGLVFILASIAVLIKQVFDYLSSGNWDGISILDTLVFMDVRSPWIRNPDSWYGVWEILDGSPLSASLFIVGIILVVLGVDDY